MASRHLALLRGINVGGKNLIRMAALREAFEALGFGDVRTFIASGNVLFTSKKKPSRDVIEAMLSERFSYASRIVLLTAAQLKQTVAQAPKGFGRQPKAYRYDVLFARAPVKARSVLPLVSLREGVDQASAGSHALYFRRLTARASQSRLTKLVSQPVYQDLTIRNWNTTTTLRSMMEGRA